MKIILQQKMKKFSLSISLIILIVACSTNHEKSSGFITKLGDDTLAVERFYKYGNKFKADVVVRTPKTVLTRYEGILNETGGLTEMKEYRFDPNTGLLGEGNLFRIFKIKGDSIEITTHLNIERKKSSIQIDSDVLPFIEYTHWPFELALNKTKAQVSDTAKVPMLAGRRVLDFSIIEVDEATKIVKHPFRGEMVVNLTEEKSLLTLDAGKTTRKLFVERTENVDVASVAKTFMNYETQGKIFGALSAAVINNYKVNGVNFRLDYGSPSKRGREIFGGIVKYGERWRTGANRATHIKFDKDITIGNLEVPAGEYTLFSIPEEDGGTLIINTQTGQNGRNYNPDLDLGRISLNRKNLPETIENFTISIKKAGADATLNLSWGNTTYFVIIKA